MWISIFIVNSLPEWVVFALSLCILMSAIYYTLWERVKMLQLNNSYTDPKRESEGVWEDYYEGSKLLIASKNNPEYKAMLARLAQRHKLKIGSKNIRPENMVLMRDITAEAMATHILMDWKGISVMQGDETPYSPAVGKTALLNSSELFEFVDSASDDQSRFYAEREEEVKKPSSGTSSGENL